MKKPISLEVDFEANAAYLEYRSLEADGRVTRTHRVHDAVQADFNEASQSLGIEMLGFDDDALAAARHFAEENDLEFPDLLRRTDSRSDVPNVA